MLRTITHPGTDLAEIEFSGTPDAASMAECHAALTGVVREHGSLRLLARYGAIDLHGMTARAFWEDLKNTVLIPRISRCAIVADQRWVRTLTDVIAPILPCEVRTFTDDEAPEARRWLGEMPGAAEAPSGETEEPTREETP